MDESVNNRGTRSWNVNHGIGEGTLGYYWRCLAVFGLNLVCRKWKRRRKMRPKHIWRQQLRKHAVHAVADFRVWPFVCPSSEVSTANMAWTCLDSVSFLWVAGVLSTLARSPDRSCLHHAACPGNMANQKDRTVGSISFPAPPLSNELTQDVTGGDKM